MSSRVHDTDSLLLEIHTHAALTRRRGGGRLHARRCDDVVDERVQLVEVGAREVVLVLHLRRRGQVLQQLRVDLTRHADGDQLDAGVLQPLSGGAGQAAPVDERVRLVRRQTVRDEDGDVRHAGAVALAAEDARAHEVERVRRVRLLVQVLHLVDGVLQRIRVGVSAETSVACVK